MFQLYSVTKMLLIQITYMMQNLLK